MPIKTFEFNYDSHEAIANFEVDTEKFTAEMANATLEFFLWDYDPDEDPVEEVMKKYALAAIKEATFNSHNTFGVIQDFKTLEGFGPIDGSIGITLTKVEGYEFFDDRLEVEIKETA